MKIRAIRLVTLTGLVFIANLFVIPLASSAEMTPSSMTFDESSYTAEMEKAHNKLHMLYGKVFDKSLPVSEREKAKREFFKVSQEMNKKMHNRIMGINIKTGGALSHTDILLATHLLLMTTDMLTTLQQEEWERDPGLRSSD